jgi:oligopeptide/dipeptide ABC transporter ATP-binding protein
MNSHPDPILRVKDLNVTFNTEDGLARAVDGISFEVHKGETLGVVGESGCGKSVTALSIMRLIACPPGKVQAEGIWYEGLDLLTLPKKEIRGIRGNKISMIFQEPMTSLNPVYTIGNQIVEAIQLHQKAGLKEAMARAAAMIEMVGIGDAETRIREFPHQLSGGMRQRAMIAMALCCNPTVLIADEPTTALDVTIQAQILDLINDLKTKLGTAVLLITHDLGVIAETARKVIVMYAGRIVEDAAAVALFEKPLHPYTRGLLGAIPAPGNVRKKYPLADIAGAVPRLTELPTGCPFHPRCQEAIELCRTERPGTFEPQQGHKVACWLYRDGTSV